MFLNKSILNLFSFLNIKKINSLSHYQLQEKFLKRGTYPPTMKICL